MAAALDATHAPDLRSWEPTANTPGHDFPIQNLPYGIYRTVADPRPRAGVAIGDFIFDLSPLFSAATLNPLMALAKSQRVALRREISRRLSDAAYRVPLTPMSQAELLLPATIGDYTDFYASLHHATYVGQLFRPDQPLLPNYRHLPIAYHGRSSSIVVSGTPVHLPSGQVAEGRFAPTERLDYELEIGAFVAQGNRPGHPIPIAAAGDHLFGICLLNDWSARDIQRWEYQPLGPFLGKNFATSISPWVVTMEALEPFRRPLHAPAAGPLPYLTESEPGGLALALEVWIQRSGENEPQQVSQQNFLDMFWTFPQMLAHHTSNGCPLRPGDLLGSGTVSGSGATERGCLLELRQPWLQPGDRVILRGRANTTGAVPIGLGTCEGRITPIGD
jgi:fumarylacetoacetase